MQGVMKAFVIVCLLASFQLARCQTFPNVVGQLPKLYKELPNPVECPKLPNCFSEYYPINRVFDNAGLFLIWLQQHSEYMPVSVTFQVAQVEQAAHSKVHVQAQSLKEAVCQVVWAYQLQWHVWQHSTGVSIVVNRPDPAHICNH